MPGFTPYGTKVIYNKMGLICAKLITSLTNIADGPPNQFLPAFFAPHSPSCFFSFGQQKICRFWGGDG